MLSTENERYERALKNLTTPYSALSTSKKQIDDLEFFYVHQTDIR